MCHWFFSVSLEHVLSILQRAVFRQGTIPPDLVAVLFKLSHACTVSDPLLPGFSCEPPENLLKKDVPDLCYSPSVPQSNRELGSLSVWPFLLLLQHISAGASWIGPPPSGFPLSLCPVCWQGSCSVSAGLEDRAWETCLNRCQNCPAISDNLDSLLGAQC